MLWWKNQKMDHILDLVSLNMWKKKRIVAETSIGKSKSQATSVFLFVFFILKSTPFLWSNLHKDLMKVLFEIYFENLHLLFGELPTNTSKPLLLSCFILCGRSFSLKAFSLTQKLYKWQICKRKKGFKPIILYNKIMIIIPRTEELHIVYLFADASFICMDIRIVSSFCYFSK